MFDAMALNPVFSFEPSGHLPARSSPDALDGIWCLSLTTLASASKGHHGLLLTPGREEQPARLKCARQKWRETLALCFPLKKYKVELRAMVVGRKMDNERVSPPLQ